MRRASGNIVANPVLVGAVTVLVVVVAVFLAYNANNGLPFVPTRTLKVEASNGDEVGKGVEVREGGYRIGVVEDTYPSRVANGRVGAVLRLKIDEAAGAIPVDSHMVIRPRSPLALKILELERGHSRTVVADGGRLPVQQTRSNTDLDQLFTVFDRPTRAGVRGNLLGFGSAFMGRGTSLNQTISLLPELFAHLSPVMRNLSAPQTDLGGFFRSLNRFTGAIAPVSKEFARGFGEQATTYAAIVRSPQALRDTISKSPPTMDASITSFRVNRPFLRETTKFSRDLNGVATELRAALPTVNDALRVGTPVTRRSVQLNNDLRGALVALGDLAAAPTTNAALRGLTATVTTLQPQLKFLGPYLTVCNYWNMFWTFNAEHQSTPDPTGSAQRVLLNNGDQQNDNLASSMGANEFATGRGLTGGSDAIRQYLHGNTSGAKAVNSDRQANCVPGQQGYAYGANANDNTPDKFYRRAVVDQSNGLLQEDGLPVGPTFKHFDINGRGFDLNPSTVPAGETFTDLPGGLGALTTYDREQLRRRGVKLP